MFTPRRSIPSFVLMMTLTTLAACAEDAALLGPDVERSFGRGNGRGNGNGSGGDPIVEDFDVWDPSAWLPGDHPLGRGRLDPANIGHSNGTLFLTLPPESYNGAEIRSASRVRFRDVEARLRTPPAPGSISAFFLYEGDQRRNDEIDIEILNDGSREILFTTWIDGKLTNHTRATLPFDPAGGFHDYRIEWSRKRVRFLVDGAGMQQWTAGVPRDAMYVMSNAWWPTWLSGSTPSNPRLHEIDRITY